MIGLRADGVLYPLPVGLPAVLCVAGAFVEVYTDAVGNEAANIQLSKKRAQSVIQHLKSRNVPEGIIIPKSYGESQADQSEEARKLGRQQDRKATVVIFTR